MAKKFIKITKYAAGPFNVFNRVGDVIEVDEELAKRMVKEEHAFDSTKAEYDSFIKASEAATK